MNSGSPINPRTNQHAALAMPPVFVSHGSPMTALEPGAAGAFMQRLGTAIDATFGRPKAILGFSAHSLTRETVLFAAARHPTIHDFGGFDPALHEMRYDAPGDPALAQRVHALLREHGMQAHVVNEGGLDHGHWTALKYIFPDADVPVLPVAWVPTWTPERLWQLGEAVASLSREGVLIFASGSITHNLRLFMQGRPTLDAPEMRESREFRDWFAASAEASDWPALLAYRQRAPHAVAMHPTDEHLLPWYIAAGAGGTQHPARRIHASSAYAYIGMDAYAFGAGADSLVAALAAASEPMPA